MAAWNRTRFFLLASAAVLLATVVEAPAHPGHERDHERPPAAAGPPLAGLVGAWTLREETLLTPVPAFPPPPPGRLNPAPQSFPVAAPGHRAAAPRLWGAEMPTDRRLDLLPAGALPAGPFSVELLINYHVHTRVGAALMAYDPNESGLLYGFGFNYTDMIFVLGDQVETLPRLYIPVGDRAFQRGAFGYWHHIVATHDGRTLRLFHNGEQVAERAMPARRLAIPANAELELAGYLGAEKHMRLGDLVSHAAIYDRALRADEIARAFADRIAPVEAGAPIPGEFHFSTGGPHLAWATETSITVLWETDRPASARLEWGEAGLRDREPQLPHSMDLAADGKRIRKVILDGLKPDTYYAYRLTATAPTGETLTTPVLRFRTAVPAGQPVTFAAISDTEARPHVNARLAQLLWSESPHLVVNAGDLTDDGKASNTAGNSQGRFEWTHEYFAAMAPLMARVPFVPVMGNGEDDFVYYERYHGLQAPGRSYYAYRYGDVEFFVLDSNLVRRDRELPGFRAEQRAWLERALAASTARWKVATFHHPPFASVYPAVEEDFLPLIERFNVDLVLVGHHHSYVRTWPLRGFEPVFDRSAPTYVQLGGGGGNVSARWAVADRRAAKTYQGYGYLMAQAFGDNMTLTMHDDSGAVRDVFTLKKLPDGGSTIEP